MQAEIHKLSANGQSTRLTSRPNNIDKVYRAALIRHREVELAKQIATEMMMPQVIAPKKFINSKSGLIAVLLAHMLAIYFISQKSMVLPTKPIVTAPMLVSLIAPPAPLPELAPIVEPPKPIVEPKPTLKKRVEKIRPIETPTQRLVEATTEPPVEEAKPVAQAEPAIVAEATKAPPKSLAVVEEKIEPPRFGVSYLNNPIPDYPPMSRRIGEEGRVLMKVLVTAEGDAAEVEIEKTSGSARLDHAAINAVKRWRFIPAKKNNQPLSAYVLVPIKFSLDN